ncbi:ABC transporter substrate-binding protein [Dactylosporangium sp. NPDC000555]|uniref:ABC transporter substrate-binding protein n=1 Tax=Dactylosporangium sp. NPDC000555 TaxID=3154260 RepID=UPI0033176357
MSILGDLSGVQQAVNSPGVAGFQTAIKEIDDAGGVNGKKISLLPAIDTQSTPAGVQTAVRQAVGQKPIAIAISMVSTEVASVASILGSAQLTTLTVTNDDAQSTPPKPYYFSATLGSHEAGKAYTNAIQTEFGGSLTGRKIAIITYNSATTVKYGQQVHDLVTQAGGTVTQWLKTDSALASFTSEAGKIMQDPPDAIMATDTPVGTAIEIAALSKAGYKGPIFGGTGANDDATLQKAAEVGADYRGPREFNTAVDGSPLMAAAEKYGTTGAAKAGIYFSKGYMLAYSLKAGLEKCGADCDAKSLPAAMASAGPIRAPGDIPFGTAQFTDSSHVLQGTIQFFKWDASQGKSVPVGQPIATR